MFSATTRNASSTTNTATPWDSIPDSEAVVSPPRESTWKKSCAGPASEASISEARSVVSVELPVSEAVAAGVRASDEAPTCASA